MSNWVGGLPPEPKAKEDKKAKKAGRPASPPDGDHPKTFYGGAIPPVPPKLPKYKKEDPPPKVKITGAGLPITKHDAPSSPKAPPPSPPATPRTPPPPPPPPPSPVSESTPDAYSPPPVPKRLPSVFDKKPKKKRKKKKKKKPPPPPPKPVEYCEDGVCDDQGETDLGQLPTIFAICHIPATRQGQGLEDDYGGYGEKEDRSGQASPRSGDDDDDGPDIPPEVPSYMRPDTFAGIFGKKIDARNIAELGPHGWHPTANAPYDVTDTGDTVTVGASGWHEPRSEW